MVRGKIRVLVLAALLIFSISFTVSAEEEGVDFSEEYREMLDALPDDVAELLPEELFSDKASDIAEGAKETVSFGYLLGIIAEKLGLEIRSALKLFASVLGVLLLCAVMNSVKTTFSSSGVGNAFSVLSSCAVFLIAVAAEFNIIRSVSEFLSRLCIFANSMVPLMGVLYAMGGNVASAVVGHSSLMIFMTLVENFCVQSAVPITGICMAFATVGAVAPEINIGSLSGFFKRSYTQALTFLMTVFVTVVGAQSLLASKADTLAGKAAKFAIGNLVPTVGSALAGTFGTISTSIEYIRASVGIIGIVAIILMLVPTLITLLVTKLVFGLLGGAADILGCGSEKKIITELASINGFLLAVSCICSVCFIFIMTIFAKCSAAAGGGLI